MANYNADLDSLTSQLQSTSLPKESGVSFVGRKLKLDNASDAKIIVDEINKADKVEFLNMEGNSLGVDAAEEISKALKERKEFKRALWKDMFTSRLKNEIPIALKHLTGSLMLAGAKLQVLDLSDNASGPIGVEGFEEFLRSPSCYSLRELRLNNMGLGITGANKLASALLDLYNNSKNAGEPLKLEVFIAGRNRLENDGAIALAQVFQKIGTLREICIPQNGIYHAGITALSAAFNENLSLEVIDLNDNTCTVKGARALAKVLDKLFNLKTLDCGDCLLRSKGALAIAESIRYLEKLETVNLSSNEIKTEAGSRVIHLLSPLSSSLTQLNMDGNMFGPSMCNELLDVAQQLNLPLTPLEEDEGSDAEEQSDEEVEDDDDDEDDEDGGEEEEEEEDLDDTESDQPYNIGGGKKVKKTKILKTPASPAALPEINLVTSLLENLCVTSPDTIPIPSECEAVIPVSDSNNTVDDLKEDRSESASNSVGDVAEDSGCCEADNLLSEISPHSPTDIVESVQNEGKMSLDDSCLNSPQNEMDNETESERNHQNDNCSAEVQSIAEKQEIEGNLDIINPQEIIVQQVEIIVTSSDQNGTSFGLEHLKPALSLPETSPVKNEDTVMTNTSSPLQEKINTIEAGDQKDFVLPTDQEIPAIEKVDIYSTEDIPCEKDIDTLNSEQINVEEKSATDSVSVSSCMIENEDVLNLSKDVPSTDTNIELQGRTDNINTNSDSGEKVGVDVPIAQEPNDTVLIKEEAAFSTIEETSVKESSTQEIKTGEVIGEEGNQECLVSSLEQEISNNVDDINQAIETANDDGSFIESYVKVEYDESQNIITISGQDKHGGCNSVVELVEKLEIVTLSCQSKENVADVVIQSNQEVTIRIDERSDHSHGSEDKTDAIIPTNQELALVESDERSEIISPCKETFQDNEINEEAKGCDEIICKGDAKEEVIASIIEGNLSSDLEIKTDEVIISEGDNPKASSDQEINDINQAVKTPNDDGTFVESIDQVDCNESQNIIPSSEHVKLDNSDGVDKELEVVIPKPSEENVAYIIPHDQESNSLDHKLENVVPVIQERNEDEEKSCERDAKEEATAVETLLDANSKDSFVEKSSDNENKTGEVTINQTSNLDVLVTSSDQEMLNDVEQNVEAPNNDGTYVESPVKVECDESQKIIPSLEPEKPEDNSTVEEPEFVTLSNQAKENVTDLVAPNQDGVNVDIIIENKTDTLVPVNQEVPQNEETNVDIIQEVEGDKENPCGKDDKEEAFPKILDYKSVDKTNAIIPVSQEVSFQNNKMPEIIPCKETLQDNAVKGEVEITCAVGAKEDPTKAVVGESSELEIMTGEVINGEEGNQVSVVISLEQEMPKNDDINSNKDINQALKISCEGTFIEPIVKFECTESKKIIPSPEPEKPGDNKGIIELVNKLEVATPCNQDIPNGNRTVPSNQEQENKEQVKKTEVVLPCKETFQDKEISGDINSELKEGAKVICTVDAKEEESKAIVKEPSEQEIKKGEATICEVGNQTSVVVSLEQEISNEVKDINQAVKTPNDVGTFIETIVKVEFDESKKIIPTSEPEKPDDDKSIVELVDKLEVVKISNQDIPGENIKETVNNMDTKLEDVRPEIIPPCNEMSRDKELKGDMVKPDLISGCEEKLQNINQCLEEPIVKSVITENETSVAPDVEPKIVQAEKLKVDLPPANEEIVNSEAIQGVSNQLNNDKEEENKQPEVEVVASKPLEDVTKETETINQPANQKVEKVKASHSSKSGKSSPDHKKSKSKCVVM